MICRNCGREISDGSTFCPYCGEMTGLRSEKRQGSIEPGNERKQAVPEKETGKYRIILYAVLAAICLFLIYQVYSLKRQLSEMADNRPAAESTEESVNSDSDTEQEEEETEETEPLRSVVYNDVEAGDTFHFGTYEQNNIPEDGKEPIEWIVLGKLGENKIYAVSSKVIDAVCYNDIWAETTWENCSLRSWLNREFLETAFSREEQERIIPRLNKNDINNRGQDGGPDTTDRIWIPGYEDIDYFSSMEEMAANPTAYAESRGVYTYENGNCWWWFRAPGADRHYAVYVNCIGDTLDYGTLVFIDSFGVRPAIIIQCD